MEESKEKRGILKNTDRDIKRQESGVTFDEQEIAEYDKQRGNKMKITEPKTPYSYEVGSDDEEAPKQMEDLENITEKNVFISNYSHVDIFKPSRQQVRGRVGYVQIYYIGKLKDINWLLINLLIMLTLMTPKVLSRGTVHIIYIYIYI